MLRDPDKKYIAQITLSNYEMILKDDKCYQKIMEYTKYSKDLEEKYAWIEKEITLKEAFLMMPLRKYPMEGDETGKKEVEKEVKAYREELINTYKEQFAYEMLVKLRIENHMKDLDAKGIYWD